MSLHNSLYDKGRVFMQEYEQLAREALNKALRIRQSKGYSPAAPLCIYDLAQDLGVEVWFVDTPSMEGMYQKGSSPVILVSSHRPTGRQAFTCAHELGHHAFNHGTHVDELMDQSANTQNRPEEFLADCFAGFCLMPKLAVTHAFAIRGWDSAAPTPRQVLAIANWFGVGYDTLITHMSKSLHLLNQVRALALKRVTPKQIRNDIIGVQAGGTEDLFLVDEYWTDRALDIQVGDRVLLLFNTHTEGAPITTLTVSDGMSLIEAATPGIGRIINPHTGWSLFVRISRRNFVGRSIYRHLEEANDE
jgi:Zn-dependent peptidase ImmA (M78 family)